MARPWQQRTELILGPEGLARLAAARVLVVAQSQSFLCEIISKTALSGDAQGGMI